MKTLEFRKKILSWYSSYKRELPWRNSTDPYYIWISEIILQQTRIEQGIDYFTRFVEKFPTAKKLAEADEQDVLKIWQGLGYYSRALNLHAAAQQLSKKNYQIPSGYEELMDLKGVGPYTAAAIASIAFNMPVAAIDGNVNRVLSRYYGINEPILSSKGKKQISRLANELIDPENPGNFNQAMMELGALVCTPKNFNCTKCPVNKHCIAFNSNTVACFPVTPPKKPLKTRYFNYLVIDTGNKILVKKRDKNDIWKNMFDFPLVETNSPVKPDKIFFTPLWKSLFSTLSVTIINVSDYKKHLLTHQKLFIRFFHISANEIKNIPVQFHKIDKKDIFDLPVPIVIEEYLLKYFMNRK